MNARKIRQGEKRLVGIGEFSCYVGLGMNVAREFAKENNIEVKIGRACRYDLRKTDEVLDALTHREHTESEEGEEDG